MTSKDRATKDALAWSTRVDMPAYIYKTKRGWKWAADRIIANMASAMVETVDGNALRNHLRKAGSVKTDRKAKASRENGARPVKTGSKPRGRPRKKED